MTAADRATLRRGIRLGLPFAAAGFLVSFSFGILARDAGMPAAAAIAMSAVVFAGSAQFASLAILGAGGGLGSAVAAGALMNSRFLPMGIAIAPSLPGGPIKRAAQGQPVVDASWALSSTGDGRFDRFLMFGSTLPQYVTWVSGTVVGALAGDVLPSASTLGLDALFPAFFLALLLTELRTPQGRVVGLVGGLVALTLVPIAPAGVPVLAASLAALLGLRSVSRRRSATR
ncbi:MAG TPA: AzlC family ABC transporter permease [Gaiellales bacterium]|nr:AzlC family ABC transporter permease [Gaiellales bacterium]